MERLTIPIWDEILFAPADVVERTFVGSAREDSYGCWSRKGTQKCTKRS